MKTPRLLMSYTAWSVLIAFPLFASQDPCMTLGIPVWTNGQIQMTLNGEAGVLNGVWYVLESSTDLQTWTPVLTNTDQAISRQVTFDAPADSSFYRMSRWPLPLFEVAIATQENIDLQGNNIYFDSYDSANPLYSTNGLYYPPFKKAGGNLASGSGMINVGNADIYGKVLTAPSGAVAVGPSGSVGDLTWTNGGIEPGWWLNNYRFCMPEVAPPFTVGFSIGSTWMASSNTYYLFSGNYYVNGNFMIGTNQTLYAAGIASVYVTGNFSMQSPTGSFITIAPGATLQLYVGTANGPGVSGVLTRVNNTGNAFNFQYYGLPSNTNVVWDGGASLIGCIYAPQATMTLSGGGNTNVDFQGACVLNSVAVNGHFNFHYDENFARPHIFQIGWR